MLVDDVITNLMTRQSRKEEVRDGYDAMRQKSFDFVNPRRYDMDGTAVKGAQRATKMYDPTAQLAWLTWVRGMQGWVVSEGIDWQRAAISDRRLRDNDDVQRYLDEYTEQMEWEFRTSNFYDVEEEWLQDASSGGTGVILTEESKDLKRVVHRVPHPGMVWIAEDGEGTVNDYSEKLTMTARQVADRFNRPDDRIHETIAKWAKDPSAGLWDVTLLQCVVPADDPAIFPKRMTYKPWALVTLMYELHGRAGTVADDLLVKAPKDRLIRVEGLDYFSPTVWRFRKNSDELYGYSPAMDIMPTIEALQKHAYNLLMLGNLAANPIKNVPDEMRGTASFLPGAENYYGSENRIPTTMEFAKEYPLAIDREDKLQEVVKYVYGWPVWNAVLALQNKRERVQATEVMEVRSDQVRLISGQFGSFWRQGITPTWDKTARIADRAGRLPDPPSVMDELRGRDAVGVSFIGPLARLQIYTTKMGGLQASLDMLAKVVENIGRHVGPEEAAEMYDRVKFMDLSEYIFDFGGMPQRLMRSDEETAARTNGRRQRLAAEAQARNARELAAASAQMGKPVDESSLLAGAA